MCANVGESSDARAVDSRPVGGAQGVEDPERGAPCGRRRGRKEQTGQLLFIDLETQTWYICIFWRFSGSELEVESSRAVMSGSGERNKSAS